VVERAKQETSNNGNKAVEVFQPRPMDKEGCGTVCNQIH